MKPRVSNKLPHNLPQLQNLIKRDPPSYADEFRLQYNHYKALLDVFKLKPQEYNEDLDTLIMFVAQVSTCFTEELKSFPYDLMAVLRQYSTVLDPSMRLGICKSLVLLRNKGLLTVDDLLKLFFQLFRCQDKVLRQYLKVHIITDIKNINAKHKNIKVNTSLQNFMFEMLKDHNAVLVKTSLDIMIDLYRRNVWRDAKTVNVIATTCLSNINKVLVTALKFFLGSDEVEESENSDSEDDTETIKAMMGAHKVNKKSRKRMKALVRAKQVLKKSKKKQKKKTYDFSALHLLHDPQGLAEKMLKKVETMNERFEIKMMIMNFISRLIGVHNLILLNYYSHLQRFLRPHQRDVTKLLMFAAQAAHELVPPDVMDPVVKAIANNFITERNSSEAITVGLNAVREICVRCPLAIDQDLLQDLVQYKSYKNKNVMMAAKSLIQLFRNINPKLLIRKDRGKPTEATQELKPMNFGEFNAKSYVPGAEVLQDGPNASVDEVDANKKGEEEEEDSDGWVNVSHSEDENDLESEEISDEECDNRDEGTKLVIEGGDNSEPTNEIKSDPTVKGDAKPKDENSNKNGPSYIVERQQKASDISANRIFSQAEFEKVKSAQIAKQTQAARGKKRKLNPEEQNTDVLNKKEIVSLQDIERLHKKPRSDKESRLATVMEGREGREKFSKKKKGKSEFASKTHKQNKKNKAFMMIKYKVKQKTKRSFQQKQVALRNALLKRCKKK